MYIVKGRHQQTGEQEETEFPKLKDARDYFFLMLKDNFQANVWKRNGMYLDLVV